MTHDPDVPLASTARAARAAVILCGCLLAAAPAAAQGTCLFETSGATMRLLGDCTTDVPIVIPDGMTLDGGHHVMTAVDPVGGVFRGGIVVNGGASASVVDTTIVTLRLAGVCQTGAARLRGIHFDGASGIIRGNRVLQVNRGQTACQEGNAIEVRATLDDGPAVLVDIVFNEIDAYQKSGIVVSGNVDAFIHRNAVGASATQAFLPANAVQVGSGARATIEENTISGNSWPHPDAAATGILLLGSAPGTVVRSNAVLGNADVGIYVLADGVTVAHNLVEEDGPDGYYDIGIGNYGRGNVFIGNVVRGYTTSFHGVPEDQDPGMTVARLD